MKVGGETGNDTVCDRINFGVAAHWLGLKFSKELYSWIHVFTSLFNVAIISQIKSFGMGRIGQMTLQKQKNTKAIIMFFARLLTFQKITQIKSQNGKLPSPKKMNISNS